MRTWRSRSRSPYAAEDLVAGAQVPLVVVDTTGCDVDAGVLADLAALPVVTVAVSDDPRTSTGAGMASFDVLLAAGLPPDGGPDKGPDSGPDSGRDGTGTAGGWVQHPEGLAAALDQLEARVAASPQASVVLVQLLRLSARLGVEDALVAESLAYSTLQAGPEFARWLDTRPAPPPPDLGGEPPLVLERHGDEVQIRFDRPAVHNAFGLGVRDALVEALGLVAADDTITAVRISGHGPSFCSGGDLREFGLLTDPTSAHLVRTGRSAARWMHRVAERVQVDLHGACIGAGIELAAFAHRVEADPGTTIALPEVGMGLVPGAGGTVSLPRRIGLPRSAYLCLSGRTIDAPTAHAWGLIDGVIDSP